MLDVCDYFNLHATTSHGAIAYLDRLQPNEGFTRFQWQMLAICCILISSKYNECEEHVPDFHTLEDITQQSIKNEIVLAHELWALKKMGWKLNVRTPIAFLTVYTLQGAFRVGKGQLEEVEEGVAESTVNALASMAILDTRFKGIPASIVAAAIVYVTRSEMGMGPAWTPELTVLTEHDEHDFMDTVELLRDASAPLLGRKGTSLSSMNSSSSDTVPDDEAFLEAEGLATPSKDKQARQGLGGVDVVTPQDKVVKEGRLAWKASPTSIVDMDVDVDTDGLSDKLATTSMQAYH
jgi:hypothetical protein